jgi:hypothetical protein
MAEPTPTQTTVAEPQKLTWDAPDGKHYEGTAEDLFKISSERYNNLFPEYSKIKNEAQQAREQLEIIQQATTGRSQVPEDQFDQQKYWQLMQNNPLEAQRYANQFDPDYQRAVTDLRTTRQNQEASIFKSEHGDFDANEANVEKLARTCQELFPKTDVYTARQMSAAYALIAGTKPSQHTTPAGTPAIPPAGSASQATGAPDITKMTQDQLKAYILQLEQQSKTQ